jgi:hypothetical protein
MNSIHTSPLTLKAVNSCTWKSDEYIGVHNNSIYWIEILGGGVC